jgi:hypothetical protein
MTDPQGAFVTRETIASPIRISIWRSGADLQSVEITTQAALNLAIDLLLAARHGVKE